MIRWKVGDRVQRRTDVFDPHSRLMRGMVVEAPDSKYPDDECYAVKWDHNKEVDHGYFWYGLEKESVNA